MDRKHDHSFEISFFESLHGRDPEYPDVIEILGCLYTENGRYEDGLKMDRKHVSLTPKNPTAHYNLACSLALLKQPEEAIDTLRKAIELGYNDAKWMKEDPDLKSLHSLPAFKDLVQSIQVH